MQEQSPNDLPQIIHFNNKAQAKEDISKAFPWYAQRTKKIADPILRMHNQAIDFYLYISASKEEHQRNLIFFENIKKIILKEFENCSVVAPFLTNKLYLKETQIQIYVLTPQINRDVALKMQDFLQNQLNLVINPPPENTQKYELHELQFEINNQRIIIRMLQRQNWQDYLALVQQNCNQILQFKFLYVILNCMLRQRGLQVHIRSYLLFALISVFYHERRKHKHRTLSQNIIKFVQYYGVGPFQERRINYLGKNKYQLLQQNMNQTPFAMWVDQITNITVPQLRELFNLLKNRYRLISNYNFDEGQSIIASLVNSCHKQFTYQ